MFKIPIRIIAVLQIIGGLSSIAFIGWALVTQMTDIASMTIGSGEVLIDIFGIFAGISLWRGTSFGRKSSIAIQAIQVPKIISPLIIFTFSFGFDLWVHASATALGIQTAFFGSNQFFVNVQNAPVDFGISITAIIALVILNKYRPAARTSIVSLPPPPPNDWQSSDATGTQQALGADSP
jgi:hypothetical protein